MNAKKESQESFDRQALTYDMDRNGSHAREQYSIILQKMENFRFANVLDVGCGTGEILKRIHKRYPEVSLTGVDISEKMLEVAKVKIGNKATLLWADAEMLPFSDATFDLIVCSDSFHHYPNPQKVLAEFRRVLKGGGNLLICDYSIGFPLRQLMNLFIRFSHDGDVHIYSKEEITKLVIQASFSNIQYERTNATAFIITGEKCK
ncbi:MAG: methyltransferase domain-containing protein [Parabacteroides sp.]|uniref:Methyltransferase domain-containing protein n=1 Tax=Parabacteroides faecalis TaxID=2924040 RepID=A0ABT0BZQ5_9BACT|nr:class I SAM-dependent methyltransferase [Parabacteroides faecalis]MCI7286174.1 methyltransferase domain-containing protein [Parabacteroides sp.]MDY6254710.1 methyltransferase domain-containing protein [Bacteroidales bacterium]MCJ2380155.1 methyltransferase domain-containing protein [Parabacteroides faecalis]MDD6951667.1 methyltransferase domain-containing protein [Parabacteroides sp.]MDD7562598.1 methyltransferase domain-containing protein [Parabacteroides sp.]